jgi:hypothetical protein
VSDGLSISDICRGRFESLDLTISAVHVHRAMYACKYLQTDRAVFQQIHKQGALLCSSHQALIATWLPYLAASTCLYLLNASADQIIQRLEIHSQNMQHQLVN